MGVYIVKVFRFFKKDVIPVAILGVCSFVYALSTVQFTHIGGLILLSVVAVVMETYPVSFGRLNFSLVFPVLYAIALLTGFSATTLVTACIVVVIHIFKRKPMRTTVFNTASRVTAMGLAGLAVKLLPNPHYTTWPFLFYDWAHLLISVVVFTLASNLMILFVIDKRAIARYLLLIAKSSAIDILVGLLYDGFMLWLAKDPKNTASGTLGTFFFFLPLPAVTIVSNLITNLTRANRRLETLFAVSQSIHAQHDMDTVLDRIVREAGRLVHSDCGILYMVMESGHLEGRVDNATKIVLQQGTGIVGATVLSGQSALVEDVREDTRFFVRETMPNVKSLIVVPIDVENRIRAAISLGKRNVGGFVEEDLRFMSIFAAHASVAMKNALFIQASNERLLLEERNRLAREIHDGLAQNLATSLLQIEIMKRRPPEAIRQSLHHLEQVLTQSITSVRQSIYSLRPAPYIHVGLIPAIRAHLEEMSIKHALNTQFVTNHEECQFSPALAKVIFEMIMECVQNVVKHAQATELVVSLHQDCNKITLSIADDGVGFHFGQAILKASEQKSFGIENLHLAVSNVQGTVEYITEPGHGTHVMVEIPLQEERGHDDSRLTV